MTTANLIYVMAISTVKLIIAVPLALQLDFSFWQATLACFIGGCIGVVFFAFFSQKVTDIFRKYFPKKEKPKRVSGRVVKHLTDLTSFEPSILKSISHPNDLPIQFFCIVFTLSGHSFN